MVVFSNIRDKETGQLFDDEVVHFIGNTNINMHGYTPLITWGLFNPIVIYDISNPNMTVPVYV